VPAQQRFDTGNGTGFKIQLGLVLKKELIALQRKTKMFADQVSFL